MKNKQFIFLYPISEIIDFEIESNAWRGKKFKKLEKEQFREKYKDILNKCIDTRYRQKGFKINYAIFNETPISNVIELKKSDKILKVGLDFKTHIAKGIYPKQDYILNQLNDDKVIRIAGFHMWDCVERLAKKAYERGLNTLVDEDLTEFFGRKFLEPKFNIKEYEGIKQKYSRESLDMIIEARKNKPWLWQKY